MSAEVWGNSINHARHVVKLHQKTCTCLEWQHTGKPCEHALAFLTTQRNVKLDEFVHEYYSLEKFKATYERMIEPMTNKSQWPKVELPFVVGAPLAKRNVGRQRKLRIKGCLEAGRKYGGNPDGKNMIRGPVTCQRCGEKDLRQASYKCPLNGTSKSKRKPRKNTTKARLTEVSTPQRPTRDSIIQDSPGVLTRSRLAFLLGEGTSSQSNMTTPQQSNTPPRAKKITPKRKLQVD